MTGHVHARFVGGPLDGQAMVIPSGSCHIIHVYPVEDGEYQRIPTRGGPDDGAHVIYQFSNPNWGVHETAVIDMRTTPGDPGAVSWPPGHLVLAPVVRDLSLRFVRESRAFRGRMVMSWRTGVQMLAFATPNSAFPRILAPETPSQVVCAARAEVSEGFSDLSTLTRLKPAQLPADGLAEVLTKALPISHCMRVVIDQTIPDGVVVIRTG